MATPSWFNYEFYMGAKLAQMQKADPEGNWTVSKLVDAFAQNGFLGEDGAYDHFVQYGAAEEVAPNADFNPSEYYAAKAAQFYGVEPSAVTELQIANVKALINEAGMNAWTHYVQYGSNEGVNPSNAFDADAYLAAKAAAMGGDWTAESVAKAISDAGMTVLEHYLTYGGKGEGEVAEGATFPVADDQKVPSDEQGGTYALTVNADTVVGTSNDDVINAFVVDGNKPTLNPGDNIDGGAGTDTLNVYGGSFSGVTMKNVEIVNHQVLGALDVSAYADVKEVWQNAAVTDVMTTAQLTTKVGFGGTSTGTQSVTFTKADGTADAATVALNGVNMTSVTVESTAANTIEAQNLDLSGKNVLETLANEAMTSLTITGDGSLAQTSDGKAAVAVGTGVGHLKSVDASAATGDLNLSFTQAQLDAKAFAYTGSKGADTIAFAGVATQKATIDLGTGDDTLTLSVLGKTGSTYDGGEGEDTLVLNNFGGTALSKEQSALFTNFEVLTLAAIGSSTAAGETVYNVATGISGITSYKADLNARANGATVTLTGLANDSTVSVKGIEDATGDNTLSLQLSTKAAAAKDASVNVTFDNESATAATGSQIDNLDTNAKELNITSNGLVTDPDDTHNAATLGTVTSLDTITIDGDQAFDLTTGVSAALTKIDGSEATGKLVINAVAHTTEDMTITGGSADDTITTGAVANTIIGGAGADKIDLTASSAKGDTIKLTAQSDSTADAFDHVIAFTAGAANSDVLDLTDFGFKGKVAAFGDTDAVTIKGAGETATFTISANDAATFFKGTDNVTKGVVVATNGTDSFVFIDADGNGQWDADADSVILLQGVKGADLTDDNFVFTA